MAISATSRSGLSGPVSAEQYVFRLLMDRAASKLEGNDVDRVKRAARFALADAGQWTDDIRIGVHTKRPFKASKHCIRMLHGVPSPRMWAPRTTSFPEMTAKDAIYFFANSEADRRDMLGDAIPNLGSAEDLTAWLKSFSSTRFEKQLVEGLVALRDTPANLRWAVISEPMVLRQIALIGAEIDRLAWFTGQRSMTLANAAPVWRP